MSLPQLIILACLQGLTEFLPVSSSAHLVFLPKLLSWEDQGLVIDVALHVGTLLAVLLYFWRDILLMLNGSMDLIAGKITKGVQLIIHLVIATLPAVIVGFLISTYAGDSVRSLPLIAFNTIVFGCLMYWADTKPVVQDLNWTWRKALFVGLGQALALVPGVSRSGICLTTARTMGFSRVEAARFAFLLSIPAILGAATLTGYKVYKIGDYTLFKYAAIGAGVACVVGLATIAGMMRWIQNSSLKPFVWYRLGLGVFLLYFWWTGVIS